MEYTRPPFKRVELSDWMAQTPGVSMMAVSDMVWPGTHDTGSYDDALIQYDIPASGFTRHQFLAGFRSQWIQKSPTSRSQPRGSCQLS